MINKPDINVLDRIEKLRERIENMEKAYQKWLAVRLQGEENDKAL